MGLRHQILATDRNWRGLNVKEPDTNLDPRESPDCEDVDFWGRQIAKRRGSTRVNATALPGMSLFFPNDSVQQPRVEIPDNSAYAFGTAFSIEFGFNFSSPTTDSSGNSIPPTGTVTALSKDVAGASGWNISFNGAGGAGRLHAAFVASAGVFDSVTSPADFQFVPNRNYFASVIREGQDLRMYIDGQLLSSSSCTSAVFLSNTRPLIIGAYSDTAGVYSGFWTGRIGEVRLWSSARTTAQVLADSGRHVFVDERQTTESGATTLIGNWRLDDGTGYRVADLSTNQNYGYRRPNPPEWAPGLMASASEPLQPADYALRFDGLGSYVQLESTRNTDLLAHRSSNYFSVQFRFQLATTVTGVYLYSHGPPHTTFSTYGFSASPLQVFTAASGATTILGAEFAGLEAAAVTSTRTATQLLNSLALSAGASYDVSIVRASSTISLAVRAASGSYTRATGTFTFFSPQMGIGFPVILGGRCGPVAYGSGTPQPYFFGATGSAFAGLIDEVRFWSKSMVGIEAQDTEVPGPAARTDLLCYLRFREGSGSYTKDASNYDLPANLLPTSAGPRYETGVVSPLLGPPVYGSSYYQRVNQTVTPGAFQDRCIVAQAGADLRRIDLAGYHESLATALTPGIPSSFATHRDLLLWGNGIDRNRKYDGVRLENLGIDPPTSSATVQAITLSGTLAHTAAAAGIQGGPSLKTAFMTDRTEKLEFWNSYPVRFTANPAGTPQTETSTVTFYTPPTAQNPATFLLWAVTGTPTASRTSYVFRNFTPFGQLSAIPRILLTSTAFLESFHLYSTDPAFTATLNNHRILAATPVATGSESYGFYAARVTFTPAITEAIRSQQFWAAVSSTYGVMCFQTALASVSFSTHPYAYTLPSAGKLSGSYRYATSFVNPRTGTESDLSPFSASLTASSNALRVTGVPTSSDSQVGQRNIYRERTTSGDWFLSGSLTDNSTTVFEDDSANSDVEIPSRIHSLRHGVPPNAQFISVFQDRAFYAGILAYPNRVYFSDVGFPEYVPAENFLPVETADGDIITGISPAPGGLAVFKRTRSRILRGLDVDTADSEGRLISGMLGARVESLDEGVGCLGHQTIVPVENRLFWASDRGVFSYDGQKLVQESEAIEPGFRVLNPSRLPWAVAGHRRLLHCYVLSVPSVISGQNDLCYVLDYVSGSWTRWSRRCSSLLRVLQLTGEDQLLFFDYHGFLYIMDPTVLAIPHFNEMGPGYTDAQLVGTVGTRTNGYDWTASGSPGFPTTGDGLKGARVFYRTAAGADLGNDVIVWNSATRIRTATSASFHADSVFHIAPIRAYYRSSWFDLGEPSHPKRLEFVHFDQATDSSGTLTLEAAFNRYGTVRSTRSVSLASFQQRVPMRGRGYHFRVSAFQYAPNQSFGITNLALEVEQDKVR